LRSEKVVTGRPFVKSAQGKIGSVHPLADLHAARRAVAPAWVETRMTGGAGIHLREPRGASPQKVEGQKGGCIDGNKQPGDPGDYRQVAESALATADAPAVVEDYGEHGCADDERQAKNVRWTSARLRHALIPFLIRTRGRIGLSGHDVARTCRRRCATVPGSEGRRASLTPQRRHNRGRM